MIEKQIIATSGGFSIDSNDKLDRYILEQTKKKNPKICFIPTASADSDGYVVKFYSFFSKLRCTPSHFSFYRPSTNDLEEFFFEKDILYVGGGNTLNMIAIWKAWEFDKILRTAWEKGIILTGISAGAMCWFEHGHTDSYSSDLSVMECLGFINGSCSPHFDSEEKRRASFKKYILNGSLKEGYGIDDGAAIHFKNDKLFKAISSRKDSKVYHLRLEKNKISETVIATKYLR
jgi:dipeptidase E